MFEIEICSLEVSLSDFSYGIFSIKGSQSEELSNEWKSIHVEFSSYLLDKRSIGL